MSAARAWTPPGDAELREAWIAQLIALSASSGGAPVAVEEFARDHVLLCMVALGPEERAVLGVSAAVERHYHYEVAVRAVMAESVRAVGARPRAGHFWTVCLGHGSLPGETRAAFRQVRHELGATVTGGVAVKRPS